MTEETWEKIRDNWPGGWIDSGFGKIGFPNDTPYDHFGLLEAIGRKYRILTVGMIRDGACFANKTAILIHFPDPGTAPRGLFSWLWRLLFPLMHQHWVILKEVRSDRVSVWYGGTGPDQTKTWTWDEFIKLYAGGWPACAYEIDKGDGKLTRWQWFVAKTTGKFV